MRGIKGGTLGNDQTDQTRNAATEDGSNTGQTSAPDGFAPITSQAEFEARLKDRLNRERAKFADYKELRAKAERFDQLEEAQKSELQKLADRLEATERQRAAAEARALRHEVAAEFGITREHAELFLTASDEAALRQQAEAFAGVVEQRKRNGNHVPGEGSTPQTGDTDERAAVRALFGGSP